MKVVLDSLMWVSYSTHADGIRAAAIDRAIRHRVRLFVSDYIFSEVETVLGGKFEKPARFVRRSRRGIQRLTTTISLPDKIPNFVTGDPGDNPIIQTALTAKADYIVTADKVLLGLQRVHDVVIIGLDDWIALLPAD